MGERLFRESTDNDHRIDALLMVFIRELYEKKHTSVKKEDLIRVLPFYIFFLRYIGGTRFKIPQIFERDVAIQGTLTEGAISGLFHTRGPSHDDRYHFNGTTIARHLTSLFIDRYLDEEEAKIATEATRYCMSAYTRKLKWKDVDPFEE